MFFISDTFKNFPLSGNAPKVCGSLNCLTADLAESPSNIPNVHFSRSPLDFASISFNILAVERFLLSFLSRDLSSANFFRSIQSSMEATISELKICLIILSETIWVDPNSFDSVINFSFVCDENAGLITVQFINKDMWFFISDGFISTLCFLNINCLSLSTVCPIIKLTWVPPSFVSIELTKDIVLNPESEGAKDISQSSDLSYIFPSVYKSAYCLNVLKLIFSLLNTILRLVLHAAISISLFLIICIWVSFHPIISNLEKSGI